MNKIIVIPLIIFSQFFFGCDTEKITEKELLSFLKSDNILIFASFDINGTVPRRGNLILRKVDNKDQLFLRENYIELKQPRLLPGKSKLCFMRDKLNYVGEFVILDIIEGSGKMIDLKTKLNIDGDYDYTEDFDYVDDYEFIDDSTVVLGFKNKIYTYFINEDSLSILKEFDNKKIRELSYNKSRNVIAFSYGHNENILFLNRFGILDLTNNNVMYFDQTSYDLSNWSPDGNQIIFVSGDIKNFSFNLNTSEITEIKSLSISTGLEIGECFYYNDSLIIMNASEDIRFDATNLYLYNLNKNLIIDTLTNDNSTVKTEISFYK